MTERLQIALVEIAERAPVAHVPDDTYRRGRRSHRRRVAAGALALVVVCLGLGSVVRTLGHVDPPVVDQHARGGAVPSQLYDVPERLTGHTPSGRWSGPVETDLAIGTGSVAWQTTGPPVVVTARDGAYHLLDLPGFVGNDFQWSLSQPGLMLSPDGRSLAYAWVAGHVDDSGGRSGVRVLDLVSGEVRSIPLHAGRRHRALVQQLAWSPDSRWLAWYGEIVGPYSGNRLGSARGVIAPGSTTSRPLPSPRDLATAMGVDNTGRVALLSTNRTLLIDASGRVERRPASLPRPILVMNDLGGWAAFTDASDRLAMPTYTGGGGAAVWELGRDETISHGFPGHESSRQVSVQPMGWIDDRHLVAEVLPDQGAPSLVVIESPIDDLVSVHTITRSETSTPSFSVAVDLMTPDRYTADLPAPDWPWSAERKLLTAFSLVVGTVLLAWAVLRFVRRRRYLAVR